jgi:hypothetical protein
MMRVLHLPTTVGGNPSGLSQHLKLLGVDSQVWAVSQNYLNYPVDRVITNTRDGALVSFVKVLCAGSYVFGHWDAVHFNYGNTLFSKRYDVSGRRGASRLGRLLFNGAATVLQTLELWVLRVRRIPVFVHYQGDDARQGDYSMLHFDINIATQVVPGYYTPESDMQKRSQISRLARQASGIYAVNPDLMHVLPPIAKFLPYGHISLQDCEPQYSQAKRQRFVFAHAPSNRQVKGTDLILRALRELSAEGHSFDLDLIEGVSNSDALARYRDADVVIDQLYAGWYGGVALEAMALGKPVVVYIRETDLRFISKAMASDLPVFRTTPYRVKEDLRTIIELPRSELVARGVASRAYVEKWHDPLEIASGIANDYRRAARTNRLRSAK